MFIMGSEKGFTFFETIVSLLIISVVATFLTKQYTQFVSVTYDQAIKTATQVRAQAIVQAITSELRLMGNGVPFDQANFQIGESTLSDPTVTEPMDAASATASYLAIRLNELGHVHLLSDDFDPSSTLVVSLTGVDEVEANDIIYISNSVVSGDDGLYAVVDSVDEVNKRLTLKTGYISSPGSTFDMGSTLERIAFVEFNSDSSTDSITRTSDGDLVELGADSSFSLKYLDSSGTEISLPITNADVVNSLRAIEVTVSAVGNKNLKDGSPYSVSVSQVVGIRNLNYLF